MSSAAQPPFSSEYSKGSQPTSAAVAEAPAALGVPATSATEAVAPAAVPPTTELFKPERYGVGKPRRIVIRGKVSRD